MPVWHVPKHVTPAPQIAKENQAWNNVKSYAWLVLMHVTSVPQLAEVWRLILQNQPNNVLKPVVNVLKPAVHVPKNVKSIHTWSLVKNAEKNAESVKQNVKSVRQNAKLFSLKISESTGY